MHYAERTEPSLPNAVRSSLQILRTRYLMTGMSASLGDSREALILKLLAAFSEVGASWTLVGAHAVGMLTERAAADFDFVVEERKLRALLQRRGYRRRRATTDVRLRTIDVDLIRSGAHPLFRQSLTETQTIDRWRIPRSELLIALKFLSSVSPWRGRDRRARDTADLISLYNEASGALDRERILSFAAQVYPGAEREFGDILDRIDNGEPISI